MWVDQRWTLVQVIMLDEFMKYREPSDPTQASTVQGGSSPGHLVVNVVVTFVQTMHPLYTVRLEIQIKVSHSKTVLRASLKLTFCVKQVETFEI